MVLGLYWFIPSPTAIPVIGYFRGHCWRSSPRQGIPEPDILLQPRAVSGSRFPCLNAGPIPTPPKQLTGIRAMGRHTRSQALNHGPISQRSPANESPTSHLDWPWIFFEHGNKCAKSIFSQSWHREVSPLPCSPTSSPGGK